MNKVILIGRLTAKPELRYTGSNVAFTRFTVAVNRNFAGADGERKADFINVVAWRKQAETISKYFDKGNQIALEGRLQAGSYDDKDGNKRYTMDVALDNFEFVLYFTSCSKLAQKSIAIVLTCISTFTHTLFSSKYIGVSIII